MRSSVEVKVTLAPACFHPDSKYWLAPAEPSCNAGSMTQRLVGNGCRDAVGMPDVSANTVLTMLCTAVGRCRRAMHERTTRRSADGYQKLALKAAHIPRPTASWRGTTCVSLQAHSQRSFRAQIIEASNSIACNCNDEDLRFQLRRCRAYVRTHAAHLCTPTARTVSSCTCTVPHVRLRCMHLRVPAPPNSLHAVVVTTEL